jgi:hypothetical protein
VIEKDSVASLATSAAELKAEVQELRKSVNQIGPRVRRVEVLALLCVLAVIAAVLGFVFVRQADTDSRIDGLCPLFALIIGGADPESRPEGPARDQYNATIRVITQAYSQLDCLDPLVPPRTGT